MKLVGPMTPPENAAVAPVSPAVELQALAQPARRPASAARLVSVFLLLCVIWGTTWLFIKVGLRDLPPLSFAGVRFVIAATVLFGANVLRGVPLLPRNRAEWTLLAGTGVLTFSINYGLLFWGEQHISSGLASLLQATIPAFGLVIAHVYLPGEQLSWPKVLGVALGLVGVAVIFLDQLDLAGRMALWGSAAVVLGALSVAWSNVLIKARLGRLDPAVMASWQMSFGLVPLLAYGVTMEGNPLALHWTRSAVVCLLYLALVGSSLAFFLAYWLVRHMDVTKTLLISLVTPIIAVAIGNVSLGETLSGREAAGGLCVLAGIGMVVYRRRVRVAS